MIATKEKSVFSPGHCCSLQFIEHYGTDSAQGQGLAEKPFLMETVGSGEAPAGQGECISSARGPVKGQQSRKSA